MRLPFLLTIGFFSFFLSCQSPQKALMAPGKQVSLVDDRFAFTEGPAADREGNVYFTDQPNNRIYKWSAEDNSVEIYMDNAGRANGLYFDKQGNLLACADEHFQLWRIDAEKTIEVLVDGFEGKKLNGPNDLWIDKNGGIYFTDPYYQRPYWERTEKEIAEERVYYLSPDQKELSIVADHFVKPNGIIGSKDGKTLYIADIGDKKTYAYTIEKDGQLSDQRLFTEMGSDGMTIDEKGNVYLTGNGVTIFNPKGQKIGHIPVPQNWTANVTFGGKDHKTLFITASKAVYTMKMKVRGVKR